VVPRLQRDLVLRERLEIVRLLELLVALAVELERFCLCLGGDAFGPRLVVGVRDAQTAKQRDQDRDPHAVTILLAGRVQ
jgi:hypothetical protein